MYTAFSFFWVLWVSRHHWRWREAIYTFMCLYTRVCRFWSVRCCSPPGSAGIQGWVLCPWEKYIFYIVTMAVIICEILLYCSTSLEYAVNSSKSVSLGEKGSLFFIALVLIGVGSKTDRKWNWKKNKQVLLLRRDSYFWIYNQKMKAGTQEVMCTLKFGAALHSTWKVGINLSVCLQEGCTRCTQDSS